MRLATLLLCLALTLTGCPLGQSTPTPPTAALVLRTYDVPAGSGQRLRSVLKEVLWFGAEGKDASTWVGRVDVGPDGRLIVLAPESVHDSRSPLAQAFSRSARVTFGSGCGAGAGWAKAAVARTEMSNGKRMGGLVASWELLVEPRTA